MGLYGVLVVTTAPVVPALGTGKTDYVKVQSIANAALEETAAAS